MAKLERERPGIGPLVRGFSTRGFRVADDRYEDGLLLTPEAAVAWTAPALEALTGAALAPLLTLVPLPEFVLLGTGAALRRPPPDLVAAAEARGVGIEAMDSRAAARAWNVLRAEGRWIGAALLPLG